MQITINFKAPSFIRRKPKATLSVIEPTVKSKKSKPLSRLTPKQRSDIVRRGWETRRKNNAKPANVVIPIMEETPPVARKRRASKLVSARTPEQRASIGKKIRETRKANNAKLSPWEIAVRQQEANRKRSATYARRRAENGSGVKKARPNGKVATRTDEDRRRISRNLSAGHAAMTPEQKRAQSDKLRISNKKTWAGKTPEELAEHGRKVSAGRAKATPEQKEASRERMSKSGKRTWANMTATQRAYHGRRVSEGHIANRTKNS